MKYITYLIFLAFLPLLAHSQVSKMATTRDQGMVLKAANEAILSFFPQKFTKRDIFYIARADNDNTIAGLNYEITYGSNTITGAFEGNAKLFKAYICLPCSFSVETENSDKVHVKITDNNGTVISDTDILLVVIN